jgi:hypothetical protein
MRRINGKEAQEEETSSRHTFFLQSKTSYQGKKIERSGGEGRWDLEVFGAEGEEREEVGWWRSELSSQSGRV